MIKRGSGCHEGKRKEAKSGTCLRVDCFVATNVVLTGTFGLIHSLFVPSLHSCFPFLPIVPVNTTFVSIKQLRQSCVPAFASFL